MPLTITHVWKCDLCNNEVAQSGSEGYSFYMPSGWARITETFEAIRYVCPNHSIVAAVNGDTVTIRKDQRTVQ